MSYDVDICKWCQCLHHEPRLWRSPKPSKQSWPRWKLDTAPKPRGLNGLNGGTAVSFEWSQWEVRCLDRQRHHWNIVRYSSTFGDQRHSWSQKDDSHTWPTWLRRLQGMLQSSYCQLQAHEGNLQQQNWQNCMNQNESKEFSWYKIDPRLNVQIRIQSNAKSNTKLILLILVRRLWLLRLHSAGLATFNQCHGM